MNSSAQQNDGLTNFADNFRSFLAYSPTSYHTAETVAGRLAKLGFTRLSEAEPWPSTPGRYLLVRGGAVIAWVIPSGVSKTAPLRILGAHTDSPMFKLKPGSSFAVEGWRQFGVEIYGGMILSSWFDRDLAIAGRLVDIQGKTHLVRTGAVARVPHLAIHLDRSVNDTFAADRQRHTVPIFSAVSDAGDLDIMQYVAARADLDPSDVAGYDLFLVDAQGASLLGAREEFLASGRLDNLSSVYAGFAALAAIYGGSRGERMLDGYGLAQDEARYIPVFAAFDNEEVGSATSEGAAGPLLETTLRRIYSGLGADADEQAQAFAKSWMLSSDAGHLVHPNYAEKHDPNTHPQPGRGPLLKVNANQRYATDGLGAALWQSLAAAAGRASAVPAKSDAEHANARASAGEAKPLPTQVFVSNNDVPCGSTIGPISATRLGIRTVDVGVGLLSMHSARELVHLGDLQVLSKLVAAFYSASAVDVPLLG